MTKYVFNTREGNNGGLEEQKGCSIYRKQITKWQM